MKIMLKVSSVLNQREEKSEKNRKNKILVFYYRKGKKPTVRKKTNKEEELEISSTTVMPRVYQKIKTLNYV